MADLKISQLTAITTLTPATDVLPVVDVTGTTKKITTNQLLGSGGTATLASATITGDLTVRTNKLAVTSTGVGIGTASPSATFDIRRNASGSAFLSYHNGGNGTVTSGADLNEIRCDDTTTSYNLLNLNVVGSARFVVASNGVCTWSNVGGVAGTAMTLNATGLGVGASPNNKLTVNGTASTWNKGAYIIYSDSGSTYIGGLGNGGSIFGSGTDNDIGITTGGATNLRLGTNNTERLRIDAAGNCGIGVTPVNKLTIGTGSFNASTVSGSSSLYSTVAQGLVVLADGFVIATRAGVNRMVLDTSGNIISNVTSTAPSLTDNGFMVFNLTSNTNLRISVRGSDGVTRTANLTLA